MKTEQIIETVSSYYSEKLALHGATPAGVDWNGEASQRVRFEQLLKVCKEDSEFSLLDWGCGYGALLDYLIEEGVVCSYIGLDCANAMVDACKQKHGSNSSARFELASVPSKSADYVVSSGIFNVRGTVSNEAWQTYFLETVDSFNAAATKGFAFNVLTSYSSPEKMRDNLYYPDPCFVFDYCKKNYSKNVALLHDYDLYEFTILVRK